MAGGEPCRADANVFVVSIRGDDGAIEFSLGGVLHENLHENYDWLSLMMLSTLVGGLSAEIERRF